MQQFFSQLLQFLQQGIAAIFKFVQLIWTWPVGRISALTHVPWQSWPLCMGPFQGRKGTLGCR